jgi:hypothetical protein
MELTEKVIINSRNVSREGIGTGTKARKYDPK